MAGQPAASLRKLSHGEAVGLKKRQMGSGRVAQRTVQSITACRP